MAKDIEIKGITTNNLKGIDIHLKRNGINLIIGPSGSGKSSLAYNTVAQIGLHELSAMFYDGANEPDYSVESYANMLVTIPIKQLNNNNNVRSTIGTYFSLNSCLAKIYSAILNLPYDYFVLNKTDNVCPHCLGLGYIRQLDPVKVIDYDKSLEQVPIRCWNKHKDFYRQILARYCEEEGISIHKTFRQLNDREKQTILYGESEKKYSIKYKITSRYSTRTTAYYGVMSGKPMLKSFSPSKDFFSELMCEWCKGQKYEDGHKENTISGLSIGEVMTVPFDDLLAWTTNVREQYKLSSIDFSLRQLELFAKKAIELHLGYLFLNRTIPSLSGGELQRLRLIKVFSSQLSDLLVILDEPLSGLSLQEKEIVYRNIKTLSKSNTLLIVDHHDLFVKEAASIIALGEGSGINGGSLVDVSRYLKKQRQSFSINVLPVGKIDEIIIPTTVYQFKGVNIHIAINRMNIIFGRSGVGKSTLLREYLIQHYDSYVYVNQKPLTGGSNSSVATNLDISGKLATLFSKTFDKEKSLFTNSASSDGACKTCGGTGYITYGSKAQSQIVLKCNDCRGTGYDKKLIKYKIAKKSMLDVMEMSIDEAAKFFEKLEPNIYKKLALAQKLLLGHLLIGQSTSSLSGGENIRVKLINHIEKKRLVFGIDEPFKGLNNEEKYEIAKLLTALTLQGKTVIVVDHEEDCFKYFSRVIELKNCNGTLYD